MHPSIKLSQRLRLLTRIEAEARPLTLRIAREIVQAGIIAAKTGQVYIPTSSILDELADLMAAVYVRRYKYGKSHSFNLSFVDSARKASQALDIHFNDLRNSFRSRVAPAVTKSSAYWSDKINAALRRVTAEQQPTREAMRQMRQELTDMGLSPLNPSLIETLTRTASHAAFSAAQAKLNEDNPQITGYQFFTVGDDRVRPEHAALDGMIVKEIPPGMMTPLDFNCRCQWIELTDPIEESDIPASVLEDAVGDMGFSVADLLD